MILEPQNILHSKYELSLYFIPFSLCPCKVNKKTNKHKTTTHTSGSTTRELGVEGFDLIQSPQEHGQKKKTTPKHKTTTTTTKQKECLKKKSPEGWHWLSHRGWEAGGTEPRKLQNSNSMAWRKRKRFYLSLWWKVLVFPLHWMHYWPKTTRLYFLWKKILFLSHCFSLGNSHCFL